MAFSNIIAIAIIITTAATLHGVEGWLYCLGWLATAAMALSIVGMAFSIGFGQN